MSTEINIVGTRVYDSYLKRYRTVIKQKADGSVMVRDGNEVGTWLTIDEYFREPHFCDATPRAHAEAGEER